MNANTFDSVARRAAVAALGVAGLAGLVPHAPDVAAKQDTAKKAKKTCKKQVGQCTTMFLSQCEGDAGCIARANTCCQFVGSCHFAAFIKCAVQT